MTEPITYKTSGVDTEKAASILSDFAKYLKTRPKSPNVLSGIGPFAACFDISEMVRGFSHPVLVTSCDGVGTKVRLAHDWNEHSGLGIDLVAMNANDILCAGGKPLFFLDYYACGALDANHLTTILKSVQQGCEQSLMSLVGGETAEMPGIYEQGHFDLAGFVVGMAEKDALLGSHRVQDGSLILGIESTGFHSNGYSLVRKIVERENLRFDDKPHFSTKTWKELLLAPTQLYVKALVPVFSRVQALAHITGGGLFENLPRVLPSGACARIDAKAWNIPELFRWFQNKAGISDEQLLSTFNCGRGMLAVISPSEKDFLLKHLSEQGLNCSLVGEIQLRPGNTNTEILWQ